MAKSVAKAGAVSALDYLAHPEKYPLAGVCAVYGDDAFLKSEVLIAIRGQVLEGGEGEFGLTTFTGREVRLRDIHDALATVSLFGAGRRLVIIDEADPFVSEFRRRAGGLRREASSRCVGAGREDVAQQYAAGEGGRGQRPRDPVRFSE